MFKNQKQLAFQKNKSKDSNIAKFNIHFNNYTTLKSEQSLCIRAHDYCSLIWQVEEEV